jgi:acyl-CoA dehydrogenase
MSIEFQPSDEDLLVQKMAKDFADNEIAPVAAELDRREEFSRDLWNKMGALGFLGMSAPAEYNGSDLSTVAQCLVLEEINRACASTGVAVSVQNSLLCWPLSRFGSEEQKANYLPRLATGELVGAYALTEPGAGSDAAALETQATRTSDGYVLDGRKCWITNGATADVAIVFATVDRGRGREGICAFIVEKSLDGVLVGKPEKKLGIRASESVELTFEGVEVPAEALLGEEGDGYGIAMSALDGGRIGIASQALGLIHASLEKSRDYALEREQFGRPIAQFQAIQWKLADTAVDLDAARLLTWRAAWLRDQGQPHRKESSMAKLFASEAANRAADRAVQIHGGVGYCKDFPVERFFRDAKVTEIYEGTSEIQRIVIAKEVLAEAATVVG